MQVSATDMAYAKWFVDSAGMITGAEHVSADAEPWLAREIHGSLFASRTVLIFGEITTALAHRSAAQLLALAAKNNDPIRVVIHSPGGHVEAGDTIFDVIRSIEPEVRMIGTGWVASAGALIYCSVPRRRRFSLPNTRFLLHQPTGGVQGPASDIEIEASQIVAVRQRLNRIFAEATGQPYERIDRETNRNLWMNAAQAKEYGLVEHIIERLSDAA